MNKPAIAVVIPCFNDGKFLPESLESLYAQTFQNWEAVVVNDGSTDRYTLELLKKIDHPQVKVYHHEKNKGLAAARNTGIRMTTSPILFPLDSDDQFVPDSLEIALQWFEKYPQTDVFYPDVIHFGAENRIRENPEFDFPLLVRQHYIQAQSPFRRSIFEKIRGYCEHDTLRLGMEDVDFWYSMLEAGASFKRLPYPIYRYRFHGGTLSQRMQRHNYKIRCFIANRHRKLLQGRLRQEYLQMGAIRSYRTAIMNRDRKNALFSAFHIYQHCLFPPKMWWRATWNVANALIKK